MGRPVGAAGGVRRAAAVPATDARDRLVLVLVLVDDVTKGLGLGGAIRGSGKRQRAAVQGALLGHSSRRSGRDVRGRELSPIPAIFAGRSATRARARPVARTRRFASRWMCWHPRALGLGR